MSNDFVRVPPDSTGKRIDNSVLIVDGNPVYRQRIALGDGVSNNLASVDEYGAVSVKQSSLENISVGRFNELLTSNRTSTINFKPTWGVSTLRYDTALTGTGAAVGEVSGEFRLQTGTDANSNALIQTKQRGQYQAGATGQFGIGIRVPTAPTGTQFAEWGYTDFTNGYWFGVDATSAYVAYDTGGSVTKVYQADWNVDKLNGAGTSGLTLALATGYISQGEFAWYGYGDIEFSLYIQPSVGEPIQKYVAHRIKINNSASIVDPNQPLSFRVGNGASSTTNFSLYVGGHQFSIIDGNSIPQKRVTAEILTQYTTATNTNWQPLIAVRKKATFNGRDNSVSARLAHYTIATDSNMDSRLTVNGVTSNLVYGTPTGWTATETALETKLTTSGTALTASTDGEPFNYDFASGTKTVLNKASESSAFSLGATSELILWVRRHSGSGVQVVVHASIEFEEEW